MAGLNEFGYRTDPGYQILSVRLIGRPFGGGRRLRPGEEEVVLEEQPRPLQVKYEQEQGMFLPVTKQDQELLETLINAGFSLVETIVEGEEGETPETQLLVRKGP